MPLRKIVRETYITLKDIKFNSLNEEISHYGDGTSEKWITEYVMRDDPTIRITLNRWYLGVVEKVTLSYLEGTDKTTLEPLRQIINKSCLEKIARQSL